MEVFCSKDGKKIETMGSKWCLLFYNRVWDRSDFNSEKSLLQLAKLESVFNFPLISTTTPKEAEAARRVQL